MAKTSDEAILRAWMKAWNDSDCTNPMGKEIDKRMMESGISIFDVHTRLGIIAGKPRKDRTQGENRLFDFWLRAKLVAENALVDKCTESTQGSMFILKSRYGYKDGMEVSFTDKEDRNKVQRVWGNQKIEESAPEEKKES